jgi:monothiol glutaredoxin
MSQEDNVQREIDELVKSQPVVLFMKGVPQAPQCGFSAKVTGILNEYLDDYTTVNVLDRPEIRDGIKTYANWPTVPQLYVKGEFLGGCDIITEMADSGELGDALGVELPEVSEPQITITAKAIEVLRDAPSAEGQQVRLRISKQFEYELQLGPRSATDFAIEQGGVTLLIDRMSAARADGMKLDFAEEDGQSGFKIDNPNEASA